MASFVHIEGRDSLARGDVVFEPSAEAPSDWTISLHMDTTSADTDLLIEFWANIVTPAEHDGGAYVRKDIITDTLVVDTGNDRVEYSGANITWTALDAGATATQGMILFADSGADATSPLFAWIDSGGGFPFTSNGGDVTVTWNAEGIVQLTDATV